MKTIKRALGAGAALALVGAFLTPSIANADLAVPKTTWPVCDDFRVDFCIESISIRPLGTRSDLVLTWYESGEGPDQADTVSPSSFIDGPEVIAPGTSGVFTPNLDELYSSVPKLFRVVSGTSSASADSPGVGPDTNLTPTTAIEGENASLTIEVNPAVESGNQTIELYADLNLDGDYAIDELVGSKYVVFGSQSLVGTGAQETQAGRSTSGRWTHEKWVDYGLDAYGYDGLTIDLKTANLFTNHLFFTVYPVKADENKVTSIATRTDGSGLAANLNMDDKITVKVRTGEILTGVSIAVANSMSFLAEKPETIEAEEEGAEPEVVNGTLTISGTPVPVPQIRSITQCVGEESTATAVVNTMQGFVLVENDDMGFGVDGLSGRMVVGSNGASCGISTPVWDDATESLTWQAGAPHFEPGGEVTNKGFYKAIIPANDALLLWGLEDPKSAVTALTIQVTEEAGGPAVAASKIAYLHGNIIIDVTGFEFSKPKIKISKKPGAKFATKRTITCTDPNTKERIVLTDSYGCPTAEVAAYKQTKMKQHTQYNLNSAQKAQIVRSLDRYIEANKFICTGIWLEGATLKQKIDARRNAKQACEYAKSLDPTLSYWYQTKSTKAPSYKNSVLITMKAQY